MIRRSELPLFLTGFFATLGGVGMPRFAYTALMPQMVLAGWFTGEQVAYLGAANLLGYLVGALSAATLADRFGAVRVMVVCWVAVVLSFVGCSAPMAMEVFVGWRLVSGMAGATLMVLGPSVAIAAAPAARRAALGPLMFCGIGTGVLLSAMLVPLLVPWGLSAAWWGLVMVCVGALAGGAYCAKRLPAPPLVAVAPAGNPAANSVQAAASAALWSVPVVLVLLAYAADAFGFVPHTVFWVDYLARELELGAAYGSTQWAIFGVGALLGPLCASLCATRWGWGRTTTAAYAIKAAAIGLPIITVSFVGHAVSGFLVGALSPGMAAITSGYLMHLIGPVQHKRLWGYATAIFALLQATAGYVMAYVYASTGTYQHLFVLGCMALCLGTALVILSRSWPAVPHAPQR